MKSQGKLEGKVAFITGAGRGQGRAHAVTMAREGAHIAALDICHDLPYPRYALASQDDLDETVAQVEAHDRRALPLIGDVRSATDMQNAVEKTIQELGKIDILICNAGIADMANAWDVTEEWWDILIDINLKGCWLATKYVVPHMLERNMGGRIIITSSVAGLRGKLGMAHYCASKWGVVGLAKALALELAPYSITVNTLHPTGVDTDIISGMADASQIPRSMIIQHLQSVNILPVELVDAQDIANAALWLASDEARYVTGQELKIDAGRMLK